MTTEKIIALVLTSSVLSSILTVFVQWIFKFVDYRLDYKKKVIDKRINAYENIDLIVWQLGFLTQNGEMYWSGIFTSKNDFDNFVVNLTIARKNQIWLSNILTDKLTELNVFLINLQNENTPKNDTDYNKIGNEYFEKIREFRTEIEKIYKNDFKDLDNVKRFFNEKSNLTNSYEIRKSN